jgi:hypothetical protein
MKKTTTGNLLREEMRTSGGTVPIENTLRSEAGIMTGKVQGNSDATKISHESVDK